MEYTPPAGDNVVILFPSSSNYIPPSGGSVHFDYIESKYIKLGTLSLFFSHKNADVVPGLAAVPAASLNLSNTPKTHDIAPGIGITLTNTVSSALAVEHTLIGRGTHIDPIPSTLYLNTISIQPGLATTPVNVLPLSSPVANILSVIFTKLKSLYISAIEAPISVLPGPISSQLPVVGNTLAVPVIDRVYIPIKGLGPVNMQMYYPQVVDNSPNNGGALSHRRVTSSINSILPVISDESRISGETVYRKVFWRNIHFSKSNFLNGIIYVNKQTSDGCIITIFPCGYAETQKDIPIDARQYGTGTVNTNIAKGASQISLILKSGTPDVFKTNDTVVLMSDKKSEVCQNITVLERVGDVVTLQTQTPVTYDYSPGNLVSSCIQLNSLSNFSPRVRITSATGSHNLLFPVEVYGNGCIRQVWKLDFISSSEFTCTGDTVGELSVHGFMYNDYSPINPYTGTPYFTLDKRALVGPFQEGDSAYFGTVIAVASMWVKRVVPPNTIDALSNFSCVIQGYI